MPRKLACLLCGAETGEITVRLVEWREPIDARIYEQLPRCREVDACWTRVTSIAGEDWPVNDGRPARAPVPTPDEPVQPADEPQADAPATPEDPEWLTR
jgi:hypothetical protein